jgi:hypothetical protein
MALKRGLSTANLINKKYEKLSLSPRWHAAIAEPRATGVWFACANSGNGKTSGILQLCKELCRIGKGIYNSLEEEDDLTMQDAFVREGMASVGSKLILTWETLEELDERLSKPKSPWFVVIDSVQYLRCRFSDYLKFKRKHKNKLIIIISQAEGKEPKGKLAKDIKYDASLKLWIEGFVMYSQGRYIGPLGHYVINEERAALYHGKIENQAS